MKIEIGGDALMLAAIQKVDDGDIIQALKLFNKVDSYESMLNQVACLSELKDYQYALTAYARLLSRYFTEYDCMNDLYATGDAAEPVRTFFRNEPTYSLPVHNRNKKSADDGLICNIGEIDLDALDGILADDIDAYFDRLNRCIQEEPVYAFYDVKSKKFFNEQYNRLRKSFIRGDMAEYNRRKQNILDYSQEDSYVLQIKIITCFVDGSYQLGLEFVRKLLVLAEPTAEALDAAVRFLTHSDEDDSKELLYTALSKLLAFADVSDIGKLLDYLKIAMIELRDKDLSLRYAQEIFSVETLSLQALKLCIIAFYNSGEKELAKQALRAFASCMPHNAFGYLMSELLYSDSVSYGSLRLVNYDGTEYDAPLEMIIRAQTELLAKATEPNPVFTDRDLMLLDLLNDARRAAVISSDRKRNNEIADTLVKVLHTFDVEYKEGFEAFAKVILADVLPDPTINALLLCRLIKAGYKKQIVITIADDTYILDLSKVKTDDELFVNALSVCAALRKVNVRKMADVYGNLRKVWYPSDGITTLDTMQTAYYMMAAAYKGFSQSKIADFFSEEERALYKAFFGVFNAN